jgi:hypothetical protein
MENVLYSTKTLNDLLTARSLRVCEDLGIFTIGDLSTVDVDSLLGKVTQKGYLPFFEDRKVTVKVVEELKELQYQAFISQQVAERIGQSMLENPENYWE